MSEFAAQTAGAERSTSIGRTAAFSLAVIACWGLTHRYRGLGYDAQLYSFQALAQIHPALNQDLFLLNASQDRFALFSPFYAVFIRWLGIEPAALLLMVVFSGAFLIAAWQLTRRLFDANMAWLSVGLVVITVGNFGAFSVIRYSEDFLTARTAAEALVVISLALNQYGSRAGALAVIAVALAFHPIMALPGLLMLACLWTPLRFSVGAALLGVAGTLLAAIAASAMPAVARYLPLLDGDWLYVVRERSQYLLLDLWTFEDWKINARPFATLALTALATADGRVRRVALAAMLVGAVGLAVSAIGCLVGPVALLVQAQTWRMVWVTAFFAVLLLPATVADVVQDRRAGWLCATFLGLAWTYPIIDSFLCSCLALASYSLRRLVTERVAFLLRGLAIAILAVAGLWILSNAWTTVSAPFDTGRDPLLLQTIKNVLGLQTPMVLLGWLTWLLFKRLRSTAGTVAVCGALLMALAFILPAAFKQSMPLASAYKPGEFADWQSAIPSDKNVVIASQDSASMFVWFVLERANYLSEAQSAGIVFSRDTALEVKRRSEWLAPLIDPNWKILSAFAAYAKNPKAWKPASVHPLTAQALQHVCADPLLDFLIAKENVGYGAITHERPGAWRNWNLYDCGAVRAGRVTHAPTG
jgi:hypothetical protein